MKVLDYIKKDFNPADVNDGNEFAYSRKWLGYLFEGLGMVRFTAKPRVLPVYKRDEAGEYILDAAGNKVVGYNSIKIEYSYTNPDNGDIFDSIAMPARNLDGSIKVDETGKVVKVDISLWAYNVLSEEEIKKIEKFGVMDISMRTGVYTDPETKETKARSTWDALVLGNGETLTPVGGKRGYRQYDA